ncbi:hypothetical protein B566_EDAN013961 [Ephemera danica]|nr:hypothetical protein B566_EDAN013961 [Ephemera danica]
MRGPLLLLVTCLCSVRSAPNDLSCQGVAGRNSFELRDCTFLNQHSHIQCVHHVTASAGGGKPMFIIEVKSTFNVKPQQDVVTINRTSFPWCLSVSSVHLSRAHQLPESAPNVFKAPETIASSLHNTVDDFSVTVDFNTDASVGFLAVNQGCDPLAQSPPSDSCISHLRGTSFMVSPIEMVDFNFRDLIEGNVKKFYFEKMNAKISSASVRMVQGPEIRNWLPFFQGTKLHKLNMDHNPQYGDLDYRLKGLTELKILSMRNCSINEIDRKNFENGAVNLEFLDLSYNALPEIPAGLSALTQLKELQITHQEFSGDPFELHENLPDTFQDLAGLRELYLSGNRLNAITPNTFSKQSPSTKVHLKDTGITKAAAAGQKVIFEF